MAKKAEDGNRQDMSVRDVTYPSLAATEEAQDMSTLDRIVVPPGAFTDPGNPAAAAGSVNMSVLTTPLELSEDYAQDVQPGEDGVLGVIDTHAEEAAGLVSAVGGMPGSRGSGADTTLPEDRADWQKKHWQAQAKNLGVSTSGNMDTVKSNVENREAAVEEAKGWSAQDWKDEIDAAETQTDLDETRSLYEASGSDYSTVSAEFEAREAALKGGD